MIDELNPVTSKSYTIADITRSVNYQEEIINDLYVKFKEITNLMAWTWGEEKSSDWSKYPSVGGVHAINQQLWENNKKLSNLLELMDWFIEIYIK